MYQHSAYRRVSYAETDKMGYLYYGRYADYYETGRVEALRAIGMIYREMEESGIIMPVLDMHTKFRKPAFYDDLLEIESRPSMMIYSKSAPVYWNCRMSVYGLFTKYITKIRCS